MTRAVRTSAGLLALAFGFLATTAVLPTAAQAQAPAFHGIASAKNCTSPVEVGNPYLCQYQVSNTIDTAPDTLMVTGISDTVTNVVPPVISGELIDLVNVSTAGGATCTPAGTPRTCTLPPGGSVVFNYDLAYSFYTVQPVDANHPSPVNDQLSVAWFDTCDGGSSNCNGDPQTATSPGSATVIYCGDTIINDDETCDDGTYPDPVDPDHGLCRAPGTTDQCTFCGDTITQGSEECDYTNPNDPATQAGTCDTNCTIHFCGDGILDAGEECDDGNNVDHDGCSATCTIEDCSVEVDKQISCNGTDYFDPGLVTANQDGTNGPSPCDPNDTVYTRYVASNTGDLDADCTLTESNSAITIGPVFSGTIGYGQTTSPFDITAAICSEVEVNEPDTANLNCTCAAPSLPSDPTASAYDTSTVSCLQPQVGCRMTGGKNNWVGDIDAEFGSDGSAGPFYTVGGQVGAPGSSGCLEVPPKGRCKQGTCEGGPLDGEACVDGECPSYDKTNAPWGEWEHVHHAGPDDDGNITGGSFAFHAGSHSAPDAAYIRDVACTDPGWCVQARPAPAKQIYWEGLGVFQNLKGQKGTDEPLPDFPDCQVAPYNSNSNGKKAVDPTLHYYTAHVGDFGEPAGAFQKPVAGCSDPGGFGGSPWEFSSCNQVTGDQELSVTSPNEKFTEAHPLCEAQDCSVDGEDLTGCPDWYDIEIHCTADPESPVIYHVGHFIDEGNFQLHPPVGDSCNPDDGDGLPI